MSKTTSLEETIASAVTNGARHDVQKERREIVNAQQKQKDTALKAKQDHEQSIFKKELAPLIDFFNALEKAKLLSSNKGNHIMNAQERIAFDTKAFIGYEYRIHWFPDNKKQDLGTIKHGMNNFTLLKANLRQTYKIKNFDPKKNKISLFREFEDLYNSPNKNDTFFHPARFVDDDFHRESISHDGNIGIIQIVRKKFFGTFFERGKTSSKDVNEFINNLITFLYDRHKDNPKLIKRLDKVIKKHFDIDISSLRQHGKMLAVALDFNAKSSQEIIGNNNDEITHNDFSVFDRTKKEIDDEIANALTSTSSLSIIQIGNDFTSSTAQIFGQLTNLMIPMIDGEDLELIQNLKQNIDDLSDQSGGKSFGFALLAKMRTARAANKLSKTETSITTNFNLLALSIDAKQQTIEQRVIGIEKYRDYLEKASQIVKWYLDALDSIDNNDDIDDVKHSMQIHRLAIEGSLEGIKLATTNEKNAYKALREAGGSIPLLSLSFMHAIQEVRATQVSNMVNVSSATTGILLENAANDLQITTDEVESRDNPTLRLQSTSDAIINATRITQKTPAIIGKAANKSLDQMAPN